MAWNVLAMQSIRLSTVYQPACPHPALPARPQKDTLTAPAVFQQASMRQYDPSNKLPVRESPALAYTSSRRPEAVSATVYLDAHAMDRIKQVCREENRRISDVICEAVELYLRERTR